MKFLLLFLLAACTKPQVTHIRQVAMTMPVHIQIGETLSERQKFQVEKTIRETFAHIDATINHWNPESEISRLNRHPIEKPFPLSSTLQNLLLVAQEVAKVSDYYFDPGQGDAIDACKERRLQKCSAASIANLEIGENYCIKHEPLKLDCDGIAKGYGIELLLKNLQMESIYINWGGEIATRGNHPAGRPWQVSVRDEIIPLKNCGIATSNNFYQLGEITGQKISHYVGRDGKPLFVKKKLTVSIATKSCTLSDALATAFMTLETKEERAAFMEKVQQQWEICYYSENEETEF